MLKGDRGPGNFVYTQNRGRKRACVSALAGDALLCGWGRQGKRAVYFLLSSSGSGRRKEGDGAGISITLTWRGLRPPSLLTCVCQTLARPQPPPPQQQRQPAQRSAAQQTGRPGRSLTAASAHRKGMALLWKRAVATAAVAPGRAASASDRRGARGLVGERQGTAAGARCVGKYL